MKNVDQLYEQSILYWPELIDISDGKFVPETNGFKFERLSKAWDGAESKAKGNEWSELSAWIIFRLLHKIAENKFNSKIVVLRPSELSVESFKQDLLNELQNRGYEEMLTEISS